MIGSERGWERDGLGREKSLGHEIDRGSEKGGEKERLGREEDKLRVVVVLWREMCWGHEFGEGEVLGREMDWSWR